MNNGIMIIGADFSSDAIPLEDLLNPLSLKNGSINLNYGGSNFGDFVDINTRLRSGNEGVYIALGQTVVFTGLKNSTETSTLVIDGVQYSSSTPSHAGAQNSINGNNSDNTKWFPINSELKSSASWTNNIGAGYFIFVFADSADRSKTLTPSDYPTRWNL